MFIALILVLLAGIIMLVTARNSSTVIAVIAITVSLALLAGATALVGALVAPLAVGAIIVIIGALVTYDDIKERRFLSIGILPMYLGLTFLGVAIYFYCI